MIDLPKKPVWLLVSANGDTTPSTHHTEADARRWGHVEQTPVEFVPAARLDAANLEIATLKAQVSSAVANLEEAQILFASIRQADALAPWACESEPGEESFDEQVREMLRDLEKITGFAARQRAALTPKEPSDG